jgi:hypothetical protein
VTLKNGHSVVERQLKIDRLWGPHKRLFFVVRERREEQQRFWFGMCSVFFLFLVSKFKNTSSLKRNANNIGKRGRGLTCTPPLKRRLSFFGVTNWIIITINYIFYKPF